MKRFMWLAVLLAVPIASADDKPKDVPISKIGTKYRMIGKLHEPLGSAVTVQGVVVNGLRYGNNRGPNLRVQRINGRAIQEDIELELDFMFGTFPLRDRQLPKVRALNTYELAGFEAIDFAEAPREAFKSFTLIPNLPLAGIFHRFKVYEGKLIDTIYFSPADFLDRQALLEGLAVSQDGMACIVAHDWCLITDTRAPWPKEIEGKTVEGLGVIRETDRPRTYALENGTTRLCRLSDQLGRNVSLRGRACRYNDVWWFDYRGNQLYVENMKQLPGWRDDLGDGKPVLVSGVLDEALLPDLSRIGLDGDRQLKEYFIIRKPSWKPIDALLAPERVE